MVQRRPSATYGAAKAFLNRFTEALREELRGTGVQVQALCPGGTQTELFERAGVDVSALPAFVWMKAGAVVEASLAALARGSGICVPGIGNRALSSLKGVLPTEVVLRIGGAVGRRIRRTSGRLARQPGGAGGAIASRRSGRLSPIERRRAKGDATTEEKRTEGRRILDRLRLRDSRVDLAPRGTPHPSQAGAGSSPCHVLAKEVPMLAKRISMSALLSALALTGVAQAATLVSPPLVPEGDNFLDCYLVNVSQQPRDVTIQVFSREGTVIESVETTLDPGEEDVARATAPELPRYCKFIVAGKRLHFRASILVRQDGVGAISALPAQ